MSEFIFNTTPVYNATAAQDNSTLVTPETNAAEPTKNVFANATVAPTTLQATSTLSILNEINLDAQALGGATSSDLDNRDVSATAVKQRFLDMLNSPAFQQITNSITSLSANDQANIEIAYAALASGGNGNG